MERQAELKQIEEEGAIVITRGGKKEKFNERALSEFVQKMEKFKKKLLKKSGERELAMQSPLMIFYLKLALELEDLRANLKSIPNRSQALKEIGKVRSRNLKASSPIPLSCKNS
jgi:hypothetical protein